MSRPRRRRRVCSLPQENLYGPLKGPHREREEIQLNLDEYETIRLIDYEGLNQEEASLRMNIGRTTVQAIYTEARKKIALSLVEGSILKIDGGDYVLCQDEEPEFRCGACGHPRGRGMGMGRGRGGRNYENRNSG